MPTAATCGRDDVNSAITAAANGDTVFIPAGTCTWNSPLDFFTKGITIQGAGCTYDSDNRPTACSTVIKNAYGAPLIPWSCVSGYAHRLTQLEFQNDGAGVVFQGIINIGCTNTGGTTFRIDHVFWNRVLSIGFKMENAIGVIDHNRYETAGGLFFFYGFHLSWDGASNADKSWSGTINWGSNEFLFVESNNILFDAPYACWDNFGGFRGVARKNRISCHFETHGTDSAQRERGGRAMEIYQNYGDFGGDINVQVCSQRSGSGFIWGNDYDNVATGFPTYFVGYIIVDRMIAWFQPFGMADGRNPWDVNDGGNPFGTGTVSSFDSGTLTVTVLGTPWTPGQWIGYMIRKTSACTQANCASVVSANTNNTVTFYDAGNFNDGNLSFSAGNTFEFNKVTQALDQPGIGFGTQMNAQIGCTSFTSDGAIDATIDCPGHGLAINDFVGVMVGTGGSGFAGTYRVTLVSGNQFHFNCRFTCGADGNGFITKVAPIPNNQTVSPLYQWSNLMNNANISWLENRLSALTVQENVHYYNYVGSEQVSSSSPFNGTVGVGVGTIARRPTTCTVGTFYWANDEGTWDSEHPTTSGQGYLCSATNTWTLYYVPYQFPHPLATEIGSDVTLMGCCST